MNQPEWFLLFFVAIAMGYWLGRRDSRRRNLRRIEGLSREYIRGLNFFLNQQPDKAIEIFVKSLAVSEHTLETHLALARVFRKRGELDRAIMIHSNLLEHPELPDTARDDVEIELAEDFLAAGMLDRAEAVLLLMVEREGRHQARVLRHLISLFEQEKDWHSALRAGEKLVAFDPAFMPTLAQYCCELAERDMGAGQVGAARRMLHRALGLDAACVRASLLEGRLELAEQRWDAALRALRRIRRQDVLFLDKVLDDIETCYRELGRPLQYSKYLARLLLESPSPVIMIKLAEQLRQQMGDASASRFLLDNLARSPRLEAMRQVFDLSFFAQNLNDPEHFSRLKEVIARLMSAPQSYRCGQCGFEGQRLHWQCPSCHQWGSIKPPSRDPLES